MLLTLLETDEMSKAQLQSMACETATINTVNKQKQKPGSPPKKHPLESQPIEQQRIPK